MANLIQRISTDLLDSLAVEHLETDAVVELIATELFPSVETLEVRGMDSLDFHDIGVGSLRAALRTAYLAGQNSARS